MYVGDASSLACRRGRAAHTGTHWDMDACGLPLERSKHEFIAPQHVDAKPVDVGERVIQQANEVGGAGQCIGFVDKQRTELSIEQFVSGIRQSGEADKVSNVIGVCGDHVQALETHRDAGALR